MALPLAASLLAQNEAEIYRDVSPSVVSIAVEISRDEIAGGAGFVIDQDGHILTNAHVIEDGRALTVLFHDGYEAPARLIGMDSRVDLAVIKVDVARHRLQPVIFGDSDALVVGQAVVAIGSPHGLDATLTRGIISGLNRKLDFDDGTAMDGAIQTDAMLAPGNSGGPLLNQAGEVIGVNTAGYRGTALDFAIPSNVARRVARYIIEASHSVIQAWAIVDALSNQVVKAAAVISALEKELGKLDLTIEDLSWFTFQANNKNHYGVLTAGAKYNELDRERISDFNSAVETLEAVDTKQAGAVWSTIVAGGSTMEAGLTGTASIVGGTATAIRATEAAKHATKTAKAIERRATATTRRTTQTARVIERRATEIARRATKTAQASGRASQTAQVKEWLASATARRATETAVAMATLTPTPYRVTVDNAVNLRSGPGTEHSRVGVAQPGDSFAVIGYQAGSPYNWLRIRFGGDSAWIAESLTRLSG